MRNYHYRYKTGRLAVALFFAVVLSDMPYMTHAAAMQLSLSSAVLSKGDKLDLDVNGCSESKGLYRSSDQAVAAVGQNGIITARKPGNAVITWKKGKKKLSCRLKVVKAPQIDIFNLTIRKGTDASLHVSGYGNPSLEVEWSSENTEVASVDNGMITGLFAGTTTVTAKIRGNSKQWERKAAVTVYDMAKHELSFPASAYGLTEYNTEIFGIHPFSAAIELPAEWGILVPEQYAGTGLPDGHSPVFIMSGGKYIGTIDFDVFDPSDGDKTSQGYYRTVYSQIMLGSVVSWDCNYTPVKKSGHFESATCRIMAKSSKEEDYKPGILAYDCAAGVYIKICFDDPKLDSRLLKEIAGSVCL